jgi:type III restriction enzyme
MKKHINSIAGRLSLRSPQRHSLELLARVMEIAQPQKLKKDDQTDLTAALEVIRSEYPNVEDFEHAFPSLCFALATGVGKTRLMGAFITYLHIAYGIRHFFVLAPNLTIYSKLVTDFSPNTPKYVFQGIAEFAVKPPTIITGDNFEQKPQVLDMFERDDVVINIFNISKFNEKAKGTDEVGKRPLKVRRLSEFLGQSYFDYLAGLDDLVLIMDEAHRYRADTSAKSIDELKPMLGLELTATPQVESGSRSVRFRNVIYNYPLAQAMLDGYVKEPAVATRAGLDPKSMSAEALELLKLEDGIRVHESVKVDLEVYAQQNGMQKVKPFMLVIAEDTEHASELVRTIESESFFEGRYQGRVIQVHSGQKGAERDENVERLLSVERADSPTEVVVHVNMLKEGWDVTNLYTIVPLRAADSRTLVEQSIGRGLRLPYGRRTGVAAVDRLTIVAHDRFREIVDEANKSGYDFNRVVIGDDVPIDQPTVHDSPPVTTTLLGLAEQPAAPLPPPASGISASAQPHAPIFRKAEEKQAAATTLEAIREAVRDPTIVPGPTALQSPEVQKQLVRAVQERTASTQTTLSPEFNPLSDAEVVSVVKRVTEVFVAHTIAVPRILVRAAGDVQTGFNDFSLDLTSLRLPAVSQEILIQHLAGGGEHRIGALEDDSTDERLEDSIVRSLREFDDVNYDEHSDLLYKLAGAVVAHLRSDLKDDDEVRKVLVFHGRQIANLVHAQMQPRAWERATSYEVIVSQGFTEVRNQVFAAPAGEKPRHFEIPVENKKDIRSMLFGGFARCLYSTQKFDTDPERRFAVVLERDKTVMKWFKPGKGVFRIRYTNEKEYEPDFVVETLTEKLICEPKRANEMEDPVVLAKARAAATWCKHASAYEVAHQGKPWRYVLIPDTAIAENMTLDGLVRQYSFAAPKSEGSLVR